MDPGSSLRETESPKHGAAMLKSESDKEIVEYSKAPTIGKIGMRISDTTRKRKKGGHDFHGSDNRPGWMALMCANNITMQWLESTIKDIKSWEGAELWVVE
ncbi:hypothetical protein JTB14_030500 [Gonioctena quinquepunctata]|nr:hypothetical protein JTB14_030500 [Gonioctena quinquepunctata]